MNVLIVEAPIAESIGEVVSHGGNHVVARGRFHRNGVPIDGQRLTLIGLGVVVAVVLGLSSESRTKAGQQN